MIVAASVGVAATVGAPPSSASSPTSGSAAAIRLFRAVSSKMNSLPSYELLQHGFVRIRTSLGKHRVMSWSWGSSQFQKGEVPTNETIVLVQHGGNVTYVIDTLRPIRDPSMLPLQWVITERAAFAGIVSSGSTAGCFEREKPSHLPYATGSPWWNAFGNFAKPVVKGKLTGITSRWPNGPQLATEVDWVVTAKHEFSSSIFRVAPAGRLPAYRFDVTYHYLTSVPPAVHVTLCP